MNTILKQITSYNNLYWAYQKAKNIYRPGDIWFDELQLAAFEADLGNQLESIGKDILEQCYRLQPICPVAFPKSSNSDGPRTRQTFWISVRDQVTWLAVTNIIGRYLDAKMPFWSYGNRLYISMFYGAGEDGSSGLQFGYYRNTTRYTFRKWSQSWPLYRRHINITSKFMTKKEKDVLADLDEQENSLLENNERLVDHPLKAEYLEKGYWKSTKHNGLYWAGLDLEKFYPNLNLDVVKRNLISYLPVKHHSNELIALISSLLDFRLDLTGWNDLELTQIQLERVEQYRNLPTGLFVAGFLANVALIDIDHQVTLLLKNNRNIAHFRYVDDHLILATSFEELVNWISEYKILIDHSNIGTTFNLEKTEPELLRAYFEGVETGEGNVEELRAAAKKQTSLDPDFPSPLMTKTLAKVSKIAGTSFNLLSPEEEKNLVTDIEHLLVTDFPDHELRKDTRVSFAARMLSSIVPQITVDSAESYRLHRNICLKTSVAIEMEKKKNKVAGSSRANLITELKLKKEEIKKDKLDLIKEEARLSKEESRLAFRTTRLLLKAVSDNHDKVRLWGRVMEFFLCSGTGKFKLVSTELRKLRSAKETNDLSITFLHSLILQVLSELLFRVIRILSYSGSSHKKKKRAMQFAKNILQQDVFIYFVNKSGKSLKPYEQSSYSLFLFAAGTVLTILNKHFVSNRERLPDKLLKQFGLFDFGNDPKAFISNSDYPPGVWAWWLYNKLPPAEMGKQPYLWNEICAILGTDYEIDLNVLLLYPRHIEPNLLSSLDPLWIKKLSSNEALWYEIYKHQKNISEELSNNLFSAIVKKLEPKATYISVEDWINWTHDQKESNSSNEGNRMFFDPRLGEWMALEIIRRIALELKSKLEGAFMISVDKQIEYCRYIHPHNFKIPKKWIEKVENLTWEKLSNLIDEGEKCISFRGIEGMIMDKRFIPHFGLEQNNENQAMFHALGSILISLLSKNTELPNKWNPVGLQPAWMGLAKIKLKEVALSTYTRDIISACYSNRNIETQFNLSLDQPEFTVAKDTENDPPDFMIIDDFIRHVELALKKLKNQQLSVSAHQPRQLTPISIMQLKRSDYQDLIEKEEVE